MVSLPRNQKGEVLPMLGYLLAMLSILHVGNAAHVNAWYANALPFAVSSWC